jgi:site-specific DNA-methyltransferase (adenine-specific)
MTVSLYKGNCVDILKNLGKGSASLVLTDPPYNLGMFMKNRQTNLKQMRSNFFGSAGWDDLQYGEWIKRMEEFFSETSRVLAKGGSMILFMSIIKVESIISIAEKLGFYYKTTGIWHKLNPMPRNMNLHYINSTEAWIYFVYMAHSSKFNNNGKVLHDFIQTSVAPANERKHGRHPTQKPVRLMEHFIEVLSDEGDVVLDPFMGSGSSGVAAKKLNRDFIGIEISEEYYNIAKSRIEAVHSNADESD